LTDADFLAGTGTGGNFPTTVERDSTNAGDTINFVFPLSSDVTPGSLSVQLVIDTNATVPNIGLASLQDGGNASLPAPAPASVPEPATAAIFAVALTAMGIRRNRTNR
jgi:hypothetical protein